MSFRRRLARLIGGIPEDAVVVPRDYAQATIELIGILHVADGEYAKAHDGFRLLGPGLRSRARLCTRVLAGERLGQLLLEQHRDQERLR
jgi:hypothetical protein